MSELSQSHSSLSKKDSLSKVKHTRQFPWTTAPVENSTCCWELKNASLFQRLNSTQLQSCRVSKPFIWRMWYTESKFYHLVLQRLFSNRSCLYFWPRVFTLSSANRILTVFRLSISYFLWMIQVLTIVCFCIAWSQRTYWLTPTDTPSYATLDWRSSLLRICTKERHQ